MKIYLWIITLLALSIPLLAQTEKERWEQQRQEEKKRWEQQNRKERQAYQQQAEAERQRWQDYVDRESAAWQAHVAAVKRKWKELRFSDVRKWVGYTSDLDSRFQADFENGELEIEVLGKPGEPPDALRKRAHKVLHEVLQEKALPNEQPILSNQLQIDAAAGKIPETYTRTSNYVSPEGKRYEKMTVRIPFRQDHLRIRAQRVLPYVQKASQKFGINPKLIMAVIHTESSFNPKAISTFRRSNGGVGHAYGLMQLVPYSGGKEAYQLLGGRGEPSPSLLFNPEKNVELGAAYLSKLQRQYFREVRHSQSVQYLIIASYNTGPRNVAKAFVGKRSLPSAIPVINSMSPDQVYSRMRYNLPYHETRDYLHKVTTRMALY